ncbi:MAG: hypothetical protein ACOZNI_09815 [Myxococcota bacterium]
MRVVNYGPLPGEESRRVHVPASYNPPTDCEAIVVSRAGGLYGWWVRADGVSPGWVSSPLLGAIHDFAFPCVPLGV